MSRRRVIVRCRHCGHTLGRWEVESERIWSGRRTAQRGRRWRRWQCPTDGEVVVPEVVLYEAALVEQTQNERIRVLAMRVTEAEHADPMTPQGWPSPVLDSP